MAESKFAWLSANVVDRPSGGVFGGARPDLLLTFDGLAVGFLGLTTPETAWVSSPGPDVVFVDPRVTGREAASRLRARGAKLVVAITHQGTAADRALAGAAGLDVILGGHEHEPLIAEEGKTLITKAGSDARYLVQVDLWVARDGRLVERSWTFREVSQRVQPDPVVAALVTSYAKRLAQDLDVVVGRTSVAPRGALGQGHDGGDEPRRLRRRRDARAAPERRRARQRRGDPRQPRGARGPPHPARRRQSLAVRQCRREARDDGARASSGVRARPRAGRPPGRWVPPGLRRAPRVGPAATRGRSDRQRRSRRPASRRGRRVHGRRARLPLPRRRRVRGVRPGEGAREPRERAAARRPDPRRHRQARDDRAGRGRSAQARRELTLKPAREAARRTSVSGRGPSWGRARLSIRRRYS